MTVAAPSRAIGRLEQLCYDRHARDLALAYPRGHLPPNPRRSAHPKGFWFDASAGAHVCDFIEQYCRHSKGEWAGQLIRLEPWQRAMLTIWFGWMRPDGTRRFRIGYAEIARKNAKSTLAAAVGLYLLAADGEPGAEIYSSATKKDQAKIVHSAAEAMVRASPDLAEYIVAARNNIHVPATLSKFEPLGADSNTLDGLNPHGNLVDELHAHRDRGVWDVLDTAMGARRQPMTVAITTAGVYEPESIGWQQHDHAVKVLEGAIEDDEYFAFIAAIDAGDDWQDPAVWSKANPNLGVSVKPAYLESQARKAAQQPAFLNTFLRLHCNRWVEQVERWLPIHLWNAADSDLTASALRERHTGLGRALAYGGMDLSTKLDLSAVALVFPDTMDVLLRFYCPAAQIERRAHRDRVPYDAWVRDGWMTATEGDTIDYDRIREDVLALAAQFDVREWAFDPWNATQLATQLGQKGLQMVEVRQGFRSMSEPSKEFERLVVERRLRHGGHPVLRWNVSNVGVRKDDNENLIPSKKSSSDRIDGVAALILALSRLIVHTNPRSVYETEELFVV